MITAFACILFYGYCILMGTIAQAYVSLSCCQWCHCKRLSGMDASLHHSNDGGAHLLPTCNISYALLIQHHGCHTRHCKTCVVAAGAALKYIRDVLDEAQMPEDRAAAFRGAVLGSIGDLAKSDAFQAAALVLERFPEEHLGVVQSLQSQPELQYKYLQGATQVHHVTLILPSSCPHPAWCRAACWASQLSLHAILLILLSWQSHKHTAVPWLQLAVQMAAFGCKL